MGEEFTLIRMKEAQGGGVPEPDHGGPAQVSHFLAKYSIDAAVFSSTINKPNLWSEPCSIMKVVGQGNQTCLTQNKLLYVAFVYVLICT